ncbi:pentapeptide repeat-containing protein [Umezawaea sp. Da 62-37]|uniref:pentapeptide repeat-containing protein n=1 Tax=Umezawaea sp. Da 62-37 TaxID=3075927 RepID=UPI0028F7081C|nr:pentapeptide repeat-containing protein [Umezawaea sp. Da 62-37]WNV86707.1 pentapeptide repeat-containing protein [Umezawaea sp. Da 62-37]WNV86710.1 pentapeptide repeat-containing protein [Umezawaea sp. Da 62-37]
MGCRARVRCSAGDGVRDRRGMVNSEDNTTNISVPLTGAVRPPLPRWTVPAVAVGVLAVTAVASVLLWTWVNGLQLPQDKRATAVLEVFKLAASVAVGGGGLFALYLAARRQRTQELELAQRERVQADTKKVAEDSRVHAERVAEATERDAVERRITELYTKASDQLGSDKAAVRLAGLYALERLGQSTPDQQEAVGNLLCAYLRMPHPKPHPLPEEPTAEQREAHELARALYDQERETRQTAVDILVRHHPTAGQGWSNLSLRLHRADLTDTNLTGANLSLAALSRANLRRANLSDANLRRANLTDANLSRANLSDANLSRANLTDANLSRANLRRANLSDANLSRANLTDANLGGAALTDANLRVANLSGANLSLANLSGTDLRDANLRDANLTDANLSLANFTDADLTDANLSLANLSGAKHNNRTLVTGVIVNEDTQGMWW